MTGKESHSRQTASAFNKFKFFFFRTNFFMKENKYYSNVSFWILIVYVFTLGLFFTEDSRYTKILNRDQTDEWKGKCKWF